MIIRLVKWLLNLTGYPYAFTYKIPIGWKTYISCPPCDSAINGMNDAWNKTMSAKDINVPNKFATDINVGNKTAKFKQDGEFLRCGKCNHIVDSGYKYCPKCGSKLEWNHE